ncbi:hypothetical protein L1885_17740, partial [Streptomyces fuscigenes]|nr:hypothetical protein [Streptomyces fuscigenes]
MADERDRWLDEDAAERLLRGEPVETTGPYEAVDAARLAGALHDLARIADANATGRPGPSGAAARRTGLPGGQPGEAAALAAFRRAR